MKRKLAYGLVIVMSVAMLGGCGTKKAEKVELSLKEVLANAADSVVSIESLEFDVNGKLDMEAAQEGQDISASGNASLDGVITTKDPSTHMKGEVEYKCSYNNTTLSGTHSAEVYGEDKADEEAFYMYARIDDKDWMSTVEDLSDFTEDLGELDYEGLKEEFDSLVDDEEFNDIFKLKDTVQSANGKDCYMIYAELGKDKLIEIVEENGSSTDVEEIKEAIENLKINYEIYLDKNTYYPVKMVIAINLKVNIEDEDINLDIKELTLEFNSKINEAKTVTVPDEVKENAVSTEDEQLEESVSDVLDTVLY